MSLFDKYDQVNARHDRLVAAGRDPFNICMDRIVSATEAIVDGHEVILVGTNNYLGLTFDPDCIESTVAAIRREGTGTTGSRIANGTYSSHRMLEQEIAGFLGRRSAQVKRPGGDYGRSQPAALYHAVVLAKPSSRPTAGRQEMQSPSNPVRHTQSGCAISLTLPCDSKIGRASCRERVCKYV